MPARHEPYYSLPASSDDSTRWPDASSLMTDADRQSVRPDVYSSLHTTSYEYSSLSVNSLLTSFARPKVSLTVMMFMHATGGHRELNLIPPWPVPSLIKMWARKQLVLRPVLSLRNCHMARSLLLLWTHPALLLDIHRRR